MIGNEWPVSHKQPEWRTSLFCLMLTYHIEGTFKQTASWHDAPRGRLCSRWIHEVDIIVSQGLAWWRCNAPNKITHAIFRVLYCLWTVALTNVVKDRGREEQWVGGGLETNRGPWWFFVLTLGLFHPFWLAGSHALFFESHRLYMDGVAQLLSVLHISFGNSLTYDVCSSLFLAIQH